MKNAEHIAAVIAKRKKTKKEQKMTILDPITTTNQERLAALRSSSPNDHAAVVEGFMIPHAFGSAVEMVQHAKTATKIINKPIRVLNPSGEYMGRFTP